MDMTTRGFYHSHMIDIKEIMIPCVGY